MAWECDARLSVQVPGLFRWDKGGLRFRNVTTPEYFFYPQQAIRVLHHVRTIQAVDFTRGLLTFDTPLPCLPKNVKAPPVYVDPELRGRLVSGSGVDMFRVVRGGQLQSPWLDRVIGNVDGHFVFSNGWRVHPALEGNGLVFTDSHGVNRMALGEQGLDLF